MTLTPSETEALARLREKIEAALADAECEDAVAAKFRPLVDAFTAKDRGDGPFDLRRIRASVDAANNAKRFRRDAADLLSLLDLAERQTREDGWRAAPPTS